MKLKSPTKTIYFFLGVFGLLLILTCENKKVENVAVDVEKTNQNISVTNDTLASTGEEKIPITMPDNWIYMANPMVSVPSLTAQMGDPAQPHTAASIFDYEVSSAKELVGALVTTGKELDLKIECELEGNTVFGITTNKNLEKLKWKGKIFKKGTGFRMVNVGCAEPIYQQNIELIDKVFNSIKTE